MSKPMEEKENQIYLDVKNLAIRERAKSEFERSMEEQVNCYLNGEEKARIRKSFIEQGNKEFLQEQKEAWEAWAANNEGPPRTISESIVRLLMKKRDSMMNYDSDEFQQLIDMDEDEVWKGFIDVDEDVSLFDSSKGKIKA